MPDALPLAFRRVQWPVYNWPMPRPAPYPQIVLDHYRRPRNRGALAARTHAADGANPLCGDSLRIEVRCVHGRVAEFAFSGEACAITTATASMLGDLALDLSRDEISALARSFRSLVGADDDDGDDGARLGPLLAMRALRGYPSRRKCALLPWAALCAALDDGVHVTTESGPVG